MSSETDSHVFAEVMQQLRKTLGIVWDPHTPYRPQASGKVERVNYTNQIAIGWNMSGELLDLGPSLAWFSPSKQNSAVGQQQNQPLWAALWSALPSATLQEAHMLKGGVNLNYYLISLSKTFQDLQWLDTPGHEFQRADWGCLNDWGAAPLQPKWKGPFQALLTTFTALKLHKVTFWIPRSRIRRA